MTNDLISRRLRIMLTDYLAQNYTLREIENAFESAEIPHRPNNESQAISGQRRSLVQAYYNGLQFSEARDARKFLDVLSSNMEHLERVEATINYQWSDVGDSKPVSLFIKFQAALNRDGYSYAQGKISPVTAAARLADAKAIATQFDAAHIHEQIQRTEASIDLDPALANGTAKELVETCFKTILREHGLGFTDRDDLLQLGKKCLKVLKLVPDDVPEAAKGADTIKRLLNNLATIVQSLAELRGLYGSGHGKEGRTKGIGSRHARLAVGAASALVTFLFQTHLEMRNNLSA